MVSLVTGWQVTVDELLAVGERRLNLLRAFNAREGIGRAEDVLPAKLFQPLKGGASDGIALTTSEIESALDLYYQMAGWDIETGMPTREKLAALGFDWLVEMF
jgi:aldehyde:ferredoxin oxidoreductase